jgi:L-xylulokinase
MAEYLIGLDNGGTSTKAAIFDVKGREIASYGEQTPIITPKSGYVERDMDNLWRTNCNCIKGVLDKGGVRGSDILGIAVCGHGKGLYLWGEDDAPIYNGIVSTDNRAWKYPIMWEKNGIYNELRDKLCQRLMACQQVSLLAWFKDNLPDVYSRAKHVFSVKDYIRFRLTGEAYSEATDISGSGLMDVRNVRFDGDMLKALGIGEVLGKIAPLKYSSDLCGYVTDEAASLTDLTPGTPVAGGMFDIDACAIAADVTSPDELCTIVGTWSINEYISERPIMDGSIDMNSLYAIPGYYLVEECSATSAGNLEWFIDKGLVGYGNDTPDIYRKINDAVMDISPSDSDVFFLPFLYGSNDHPLAKGSLVGLTEYHDSRHVLRAVYESVAFSHKFHILKLLSSRNPPSAIRMAGGAVNSPVWVQMFADVLEIPIETVEAKELGALGCSMSAAVAAGIYPNYAEAARNMTVISERTSPDLANSEIYRAKYRKYQAVVDALNAIWDEFEV